MVRFSASLPVAALLASLAACSSSDPIKCATSDDCLQGGISGMCLPSPSSSEHWCAFSDPGCAGSALRWGVKSGDDLAGECVAGESSTTSVSVSLGGTGHGSIHSDPVGIDCPAVCEAEFPGAMSVSLTAIPDDDSWFTGFSGDCAGRGACEIQASNAATLTATFEPQGKQLWVARFGAAVYDHVRAVAATVDGEVYVAGVADADEDAYDGNVFVAKVDKNSGKAAWSRFLTERNLAGGQAKAVAIDQRTGDVLVAGWFSGTIDIDGASLDSSNGELFLTRLKSADGTVIWARQAGASQRVVLSGTTHMGLVVDVDGNAYLAAHTRKGFAFGSDTVPFSGLDDAIVVKWSPEGDPVFARGFGGPKSDFATSVAVDGHGGLFVVGTFEDTAFLGGSSSVTAVGGVDGFISKWTTSGAHVYTRTFGSVDDDIASSVVVDSDTVFVTGEFVGAVDLGGFHLQANGNSTDAFAAAYSLSGTHLWSRTAGGSGEDRGTALCVDAEGNVVLGMDFNGTAAIDALTVSGGGSLVARLDRADGHLAWGEKLGPTALAAMACSTNAIVMGGDFQGQVTFGGQVLNSAGYTDVFWRALVP